MGGTQACWMVYFIGKIPSTKIRMMKMGVALAIRTPPWLVMLAVSKYDSSRTELLRGKRPAPGSLKTMVKTHGGFFWEKRAWNNGDSTTKHGDFTWFYEISWKSDEALPSESWYKMVQWEVKGFPACVVYFCDILIYLVRPLGIQIAYQPSSISTG